MYLFVAIAIALGAALSAIAVRRGFLSSAVASTADEYTIL